MIGSENSVTDGTVDVGDSSPSHKSALDAEVVIVGGGPVGLGLAIDLGQRGVACVLVERHRTPQPIPKGQNLTQRTMEHFHFWGMEADIRAARTIPKDFGIGGLTAYETLLGPYNYDWLQRELVRPFYFTDNERLPQYATEAAMRARVAALPAVTTLYEWTVDDVNQTDHEVAVAVSDRSTGLRRTLTARYAVGCDGSRSIVREKAGITQTRSDHDRLMVLLVFRSQALHQLLERFPGKSYFNVIHPDLKGYWLFFGRVDLGTTWFFHAPVPPGTTKDNFDFTAYVKKAAGVDFDIAIDHIGFWDLRFAIADTYRMGRLFVAGDAAHSHPPYGGYGINTGLEDAANLSWKLAATLRGQGGPHLLESYDEERRPVFESTARDFIERSINADREFLDTYDPRRDLAGFETAWSARKVGAKTEVGSFEPNYEGSSIIAGGGGTRPSALGTHEFAARPGHHLAPQPLSSGDSVFLQLGEDFVLLAFGADHGDVERFVRAAAALGLSLKVVSDTADGERSHYGAKLVLVRPDQFVAWSGSRAPDDVGGLLSQVTGGRRPGAGVAEAPRYGSQSSDARTSAKA